MGLLREGEGVAARVFENLGADPNNIRTQARHAILVYDNRLSKIIFYSLVKYIVSM